MANKEYIERVKLALQHLHGCSAVWRETVPVEEVFNGKTIWKGNVEVFDLSGHPTAKRAYGWSHRDGADNKDERFVTVLELPPVKSAHDAVKISIVADVKKGTK